MTTRTNPESISSDNYDRRAIRQLLEDAFTREDLRRFCADRSTFRDLLAELRDEDTLANIVDRLITYSDKRGILEELLSGVEQERPRKYRRYRSKLYFTPETGTRPEVRGASVEPRTEAATHAGTPQAAWKVVVALVVICAVIAAGVWLSKPAQPRFEITAFDSSEKDRNVYEVADLLMLEQHGLASFGVGITFTLEVRPVYYGRQHFGQVVARISGDGKDLPPVPLWPDFTKESGTQTIRLTLPELLAATGLKTNRDYPLNPSESGDLSFQEARLVVQITQEGQRDRPWTTQEILIRVSPWDQRAEMAERGGKRQVDVLVRNLGAEGEFKLYNNLRRLGPGISTSSHPVWSGTIQIEGGDGSTGFVPLKHGEFLTHTIDLPEQLDPGRYIVQVYAIKKQPYVRFTNPGQTWDNLADPWLFSRTGSLVIFVVPLPTFDVPADIQAEHDRLRDEEGTDLGLPLGSAGTVTSTIGTVGKRQVFERGEIYAYQDQAYGLYGPILQHYQDLGGLRSTHLGFPISATEVVTSSSGTRGSRVRFEGDSTGGAAAIYTFSGNASAIWGWKNATYLDDYGGPLGWLGFPIGDDRFLENGSHQAFENGYMVRYYLDKGGQRDFDIHPMAYPYLTTTGNLINVQANQSWQDTGIAVHPGDQVTIIQIGGEWTNQEPAVEPFDANGPQPASVHDQAPLPTAPVGSLIGQIGQGLGQVFPVGRWAVITATVQGNLYLAMNDGNVVDNAGYVTVQVNVERPK